MKKIYGFIVLINLLILFGFTFSAMADQKEEAVTMVKDAAEYLKANGQEKTVDALNDPTGKFVKGNLYVFAYDAKGTLVANSLKLGLVGQNLIDLPDSKGKKFRREIIERANKGETGWVDYVSQHPKTGDLEEKTTYFQKEGNLILACGVYKN